MNMEPYWEPNGHAPHPVKYESEAAVAGFPYCTESTLNFSTNYSEDDAEFATANNNNNNNTRRNKTSRQDPLSHRIIEKRRRDRMNSCLADLSRLIPPQYARKGRGRIEKTEIIEMAIRHLKHLQNNCVHKEIEYKLGYSDCMKEAAKFLYESHMQDCCYRLLAHLQEHCDEIMKGDCFKNRCNVESVSNGDSPTNFHHNTPMSQLRDMLTSDISNDQHDVKDFSLRNHIHDPAHTTAPTQSSHQAPVITSTAVHHDSNSNHEYENGLPSPPSHLHHTTTTQPSGIQRTLRTRNLSESSHDIEHNNNYKYKNHIKERFNHDTQLHDESTSEDHSLTATNDSPSSGDVSKPLNCGTTNCENLTKKRKLDDPGTGEINSENLTRINLTKQFQLKKNESNDIKLESVSTTDSNKNILSTTTQQSKHFPVPIFALHGQGTYYIPLNVTFESLLPFLNGIDLLDKNHCPMLHPVNINVNFSLPSAINQSAKSKIEGKGCW